MMPATIVIRKCRSLAKAAGAPGQAAAATAPAAAATAATAATSSAAAAAAAAASAAAAPSAATAARILLAGARRWGVFLVEDVERPQADVGDLFLIERDLGRGGLPPRCILGRDGGRGGCTARQRQRHADGSHHRHNFFSTGSLRSLLRTWHVGPPMPSGKCFVAALFVRSATTPRKAGCAC
jgi:hypothetical protein